MKLFSVTEDTNLKDFTDAIYPQGSFAYAALLRAKDIKVNGVRVAKNVALKAGDEVAYYTTLKQEQKPSHTAVYEDEKIYIADKFSGVSTEGLQSELKARGTYLAVHRLDRNTQGLLVFAKTAPAKAELEKGFKQRTVQKVYLAVCKNSFKTDSATLTAYLKKDQNKAYVCVFNHSEPGADKIITEYSVLEKSGDVALVKVVLHTGKTHQIRAHLSHIGCPVLGDEKYGDSALNQKYGAKRQRLIAKYLTFTFTGGALEYLNGKTFTSSFDCKL